MIRPSVSQQSIHLLLLILLSVAISGCGFLKSDEETPQTTNQENKNGEAKSDSVGQLTSDLIHNSSKQARRNFGTILIPGTPFKRWNNNEDIVAWQETNQPLASLDTAEDIVHDIDISKNGDFMVSVGSQINVYDLDTLSLVRSWELDSIAKEVLMTPNGQIIISMHDDNTLRIWQQETGYNIAVLEHERSISAITISNDGTLIASADTGGRIFIWDTITGKQLYTIDDVLRVNTLQFSHDGLKLASSGISSNDVNYTVQIWETRFFSLEVSLPGHESVVNNVTFSPDSKYVLTGSRDKTIKVWNLDTAALHQTLRGHNDDVVKMIFSPDGKWLMSSSLDNRVRIWDFPNRKSIKVLNIPHLRSKSLAYTPERNWVVVLGGSKQNIQIWAGSGFTFKPWNDIRQRVTQNYNDGQRVLSLPLIPKPQLPSFTDLRKDPFESQIAFVNRAARTYGPRINRQIVNYRKKVDERNRKIVILRRNQRQGQILLKNQIRDLSVEATKKVLGNTLLLPLSIDGKPAYDPEQQLMKIRVSFTRSFYREDLLIKMPQGIPAKTFYDELVDGQVTGNSIFHFISNSRIRLSQVDIRWRGRNFIAKPIKLSSGYQVIPSELRNATLSPKELQFQRYGLPYTNFSDFMRTLLNEQAGEDIDLQNKTTNIDDKTAKDFSRYRQ